MKKLESKLSLKKKSMTVLNDSEAAKIGGGAERIQILSIGRCCSKDNQCDRTLTKPLPPGGC